MSAVGITNTEVYQKYTSAVGITNTEVYQNTTCQCTYPFHVMLMYSFTHDANEYHTNTRNDNARLMYCHEMYRTQWPLILDISSNKLKKESYNIDIHVHNWPL